jgi:Rrf2 family transcriptional regulator, iron-sulfur cluster assembly transcription factor
MTALSRRSALAIAAVVDVALHARPGAVRSRDMAERLGLAPRHLETLLQSLVRQGILKGLRGPRGGYELARERRRITAGEIVRASWAGEDPAPALPACSVVEHVIEPVVQSALAAFLAELDAVTVDDLCQRAPTRRRTAEEALVGDFTI